MPITDNLAPFEIPYYDVHIGDIESPSGVRVSSFKRDSAPFIAPKFATGAVTGSDLDLLKSETVTFTNGEGQRVHKDNKMVARMNGFLSQENNALYPLPPLSGLALAPPANSNYVGQTEINDGIWVFSYVYYSGTNTYVNKAHYMNGTSVTEPFTLPAALVSTAGNRPIANILDDGDYIYLFTSSSYSVGSNYRMMRSAPHTTVDVGTGSASAGRFNCGARLRGTLYGVTNTGAIYIITNETTAAITITYVTQAGTVFDTTRGCVVFNGAIWIFKDNGIYRFDGTQAPRVLTHAATKWAIFNGAIYFTTKNWLYRFDGTTLSKIMPINPTMTIVALNSYDDYLFISTYFTSTHPNKDNPDASNYNTRIYAWDGDILSTIYETNESSSANAHHFHPFILQSRTTGVQRMNLMKAFTNGTTAHTTSQAVLSDMFIVGGSAPPAHGFTTSEFDAGLPNVYKSLNKIAIDTDTPTSGVTIVVKYRYFGTQWSSWATLKTFTSTDYENALDVGYLDIKYKRIQFAVNVSSTSTIPWPLYNFTWYYTIQPRKRYRFQVGIPASEMVHNSDSGDQRGILSTGANRISALVDDWLQSKKPLVLATPEMHAIVSQNLYTTTGAYETTTTIPTTTTSGCSLAASRDKAYSGIGSVKVDCSAAGDWEFTVVDGTSYGTGIQVRASIWLWVPTGMTVTPSIKLRTSADAAHSTIAMPAIVGNDTWQESEYIFFSDSTNYPKYRISAAHSGAGVYYFDHPSIGKAQYTSSDTTLYVAGRMPISVTNTAYGEHPHLMGWNGSDYEYLAVSGVSYDRDNDVTTLTVRRAQHGSTAATFSMGEYIQTCHFVYCTRLLSDTQIINPGTLNQEHYGYNNQEHDYLLEFIEAV